MPGSSELSVATVAALVLGGLGAVVLAVVVASKDASRVRSHAPASSAQGRPHPTATPGSAASAPSGEVEVPAEVLYPIEASTPLEP